MGTSMETVIGEVQEIYTQRLSNSNEESPSQKEKPLFRLSDFSLVQCGIIALAGAAVGISGLLAVSGIHGAITDSSIFFVFNRVLGGAGFGAAGFSLVKIVTGGDILLSDLVCGISAGAISAVVLAVRFDWGWKENIE